MLCIKPKKKISLQISLENSLSMRRENPKDEDPLRGFSTIEMRINGLPGFWQIRFQQNTV